MTRRQIIGIRQIDGVGECMETIERTGLNFSDKVKDLFVFLEQLGFSIVESLPTLVRYKKGDIEVDVYHGRQSYEIGAGITISGNRYSISEIIRLNAPDIAKNFRYAMATTAEGVATALETLSMLMKRFGGAALKGDPEFIAALEQQRQQWSEDYALEVLAEQLRPKANEAFHRKDYSMAADLYSRILKCLSAVERKKLDFAIKHSKTPQP